MSNQTTQVHKFPLVFLSKYPVIRVPSSILPPTKDVKIELLVRPDNESNTLAIPMQATVWRIKTGTYIKLPKQLAEFIASIRDTDKYVGVVIHGAKPLNEEEGDEDGRGDQEKD